MVGINVRLSEMNFNMFNFEELTQLGYDLRKKFSEKIGSGDCQHHLFWDRKPKAALLIVEVYLEASVDVIEDIGQALLEVLTSSALLPAYQVVEVQFPQMGEGFFYADRVRPDFGLAIEQK